MNAHDVFRIPVPGGAAIEAITRLRELETIHAGLPRGTGETYFSSLQRALDLRCEVSSEDLEQVPRKGALLAVANHPFGAAEGIVLARTLGAVRDDVKLLANHLLGRIPDLRDTLILVDPFHPGATGENIRGLREAMRHLQSGGALIVFPAGTVSHWQPGRRGATDPEWSACVARLAHRSRAAVLPVFFPGANGPLFQLAGLLHPSLRTALLPQALLDRRHTTIEMRIGKSVPFARLVKFESDEALTAHLRRRTYALAHRAGGERLAASGEREALGSSRFFFRSPRAATRSPVHNLAPAIPAETLAREINALPHDALLASNGELDVFLADRERIPNVLLEIGRLREVTFRAVGEGSGQTRDLDTFDTYYRHLFIWNRTTCEIAGAYRLGLVDEIVQRHGPAGLYTSTLFRYSARFFEAFAGCSIEMGRSFVRAEYQKSYAPLLLLWKGIGAFVARHPRYCVLFGPASISNDFHPQSRALIASYLTRQAIAATAAPHVAARRPFRAQLHPEIAGEIEALDDLQEMIGDIERGRRTVPVLLRQYLNLGGRVAALNVDRDFCDALDALVLVDLRQTDPKTLSRYMGAEESRLFTTVHAKAGL